MSLPQHTSATPGNKMTLEQAAKRTSMTVDQLDALVEAGKLPAIMNDGKKMVEERDLELLSTLEV